MRYAKWLLPALVLALALAGAATGADTRVTEARIGPTWDLVVERDTARVRLANDDANERFPALSSDASIVVYASDLDGDFELHSLHLEAQCVTRLTDNAWDDLYPTWAAGDSLVVFLSRRDDTADLHVVSADGQHERPLRARERFSYSPVWPPLEVTTNQPPGVWLTAERRSADVVRFDLSGVWDREQGRALTATLAYGDGADTLLAAVPDQVDHRYAGDGEYQVVLRVRDAHGAAADVLLELTLSSVLRLHKVIAPDEERQYQPRPFDRD